MELFTLTEPADDYKCASGMTSIYVDPNGGKAEISARFGSIVRPKKGESPIEIDSPKFIWARGRGTQITIIPIAPDKLYPEKSKITLTVGDEDQEVTLKWVETKPELKPAGPAFGERKSLPSPAAQMAIDIKAILENQNLLLAVVADFVHSRQE